MYEQLKKAVCLANVELERNKLVICNWGNSASRSIVLLLAMCLKARRYGILSISRPVAKKYGIKHEEVIPYYVDKTALKREIKGQDIADAVVFLCSEKVRTITGQTLVADGGQAMVR